MPNIKKEKTMGTIKDVYDIVKDLLSIARTTNNQQMVELAIDLQAKYFELRENIENTKEENRNLKQKIAELEKIKTQEDDVIISQYGYVTLKSDTHKPPIAYCATCWAKEKKLIPLTKYDMWSNVKCGNCKTETDTLPK